MPLVLIVEDEQDNRELLTFQLELLNLSTICASNGIKGIYLAQTQAPDLILLDIMLPDVDGVELLENIKQNPNTAHIPVIAVTAMARQQDKQRILEAGADDYITKPYDLDDLEVIINSCLHRVKRA